MVQYDQFIGVVLCNNSYLLELLTILNVPAKL